MLRRTKIIGWFLASFFLIFTFFSSSLQPALAQPDSVNKSNDLDEEINKSDEEIEKEIELNVKEESQKSLKIDDEYAGEKGDLYNTYRDTFDELENTSPKAGMYLDLIEDFNYTDSKFVCSKFDITCHITNFFFQAASSMLSLLLEPMKNLAIKPTDILESDTFNEFKGYFDVFTKSLLGVFILFQLIKMYAQYMNDYEMARPVLYDKLIRLGMASVFLFLYDDIFQFMMSIQYRINYGIFSRLADTSDLMNDLMVNFLLVPAGIGFLFMIVIYAILLLVLFAQMLYSFALIALFFIVGPVAVTTMVNDEYNMFGLWLKTLISRFLTLALQGLCVVLCFRYGANIDFITNGELNYIPQSLDMKVIKAMAFLLVGLGIPSLLKEFGSSSGAGRGVIAGVKSVTRMGR